jgi:hypothetical protein
MLMPLGPFEPDAPWDELPQAFMAMDVDTGGYWCYDCAWLSLTALSTVTRNLWL